MCKMSPVDCISNYHNTQQKSTHLPVDRKRKPVVVDFGEEHGTVETMSNFVHANVFLTPVRDEDILAYSSSIFPCLSRPDHTCLSVQSTVIIQWDSKSSDISLLHHWTNANRCTKVYCMVEYWLAHLLITFTICFIILWAVWRRELK